MKSKEKARKAEFANIFARLRSILQKYSDRLSVTTDTSTRYCLAGGTHPTRKIAMELAWVQVGKAYVSFHHMGIYIYPKLRDNMTPALRSRMQGKSCFNFTKQDEALFEELERVTSAGFAAFRKAGSRTRQKDEL